MAKVTGRVEVLLNGELMLNKAGAKANGIGESGRIAVERKAVMADTGLAGFVEEPVEASLEVTIIDREDIRISTIAAALENATIVFRSAGGGKSYTMDGATCTMNISLTAGEGETELKFIGPFWTEALQ